MAWALYIPLVPLAVLAVQDFRTRTVSAPWLVSFGVLTLAVSLWCYGPLPAVRQAGLNLLLLLYLWGGVLLWLRVRYGKAAQPFKAYIGSGDIWLLLCLTPCFPLRTFLLFLLVSLVAGLLFYGICFMAARRRLTIPLVGIVGATFTLYLLINPLFA